MGRGFPLPSISDPGQRVSAVIVTYDSAAVIADCLASLSGVREVIVVDNASTDTTLEAVQAARRDAAIVKIGENIGFGSAANEGLRRVTGEFALLVNPDAALSPDALGQLVAAADRYPKAAALAPVLVNAQGEIERSHNASLIERDAMPRKRTDPVPEGDVCASFLSGAVMLLRKRALDEAGLFDPAIFLFYEDDDLCVRLRRAGWSLILVAEAFAHHAGGGSSPWSWETNWRKFWNMGWSRLYLEEKHRGTRAMFKAAARELGRHALKIPAHLARFDRVKLVRDWARLCGSFGYLLGLKARG